MFYWHKVIFIISVDNGIFDSLSNAAIVQAIMEIWGKFDIEYQGILNE